MTQSTALETALKEMRARPEDATSRLRFHAELIASEIFILLEEEARGDTLRPRIFDLADARAVLAFDNEARMAGFAGQAVAYAALPGRVLVGMLADAGEGLSLIINPDSAEAEWLAPEALEWLAATLAAPAPQEREAKPDSFEPVSLPKGVLDLLVPALERRLSGVPGLEAAVLSGVRWQDGTQGHLLALAGVAGPARPPLARAVAEALELSGLNESALDVVFPGPAAMARIAAVGRALAPSPFAAPDPERSAGVNVGLDPKRPPRLK